MNAANSETITVSTTVQAPIEKVWQYWTAPEHITQWCQASDDWHAPFAENDMRKDGRFKTTMAAKDGSFQFDFEGVYTDVVPNKSMAYTMDDGRKVKIDFLEKENTVEIIETFEPESTNSLEQQRQGWQNILDSFGRYVESH